MKKYYVMGIETSLTSGVMDYYGHVHHDLHFQWSKPHASLSDLMTASEEFLSKFELAANQRIVIETREVADEVQE